MRGFGEFVVSCIIYVAFIFVAAVLILFILHDEDLSGKIGFSESFALAISIFIGASCYSGYKSVCKDLGLDR